MILNKMFTSSQGLLTKPVIFNFACHLTHYDIPSADQKTAFDLEAATWIPPIYVKNKANMRPGTAKPKDPDEHTFENEDVANDYKKLWKEYQELQKMREEMMKKEEEGVEEKEGQKESTEIKASPKKKRPPDIGQAKQRRRKAN